MREQREAEKRAEVVSIGRITSAASEPAVASASVGVMPSAPNPSDSSSFGSTDPAPAAAAASDSAAAAASYDSNLDKLDLLTGGFAESHVPGTSLGPTFLTLFSLTVAQIRASDRFWYERRGSLDDDPATDAALRSEVQKTNFGDIISRNTRIPRHLLPHNVFFVPEAECNREHRMMEEYHKVGNTN